MSVSSEMKCQCRIAVVAHVFYGHLWPELARCIRNFDKASSRVFVTVTDDKLKDIVLHDFPDATIEVVSNQGYDILPFWRVLSKISLADFDLVAKLHTKRDCDDWVNCWPIFGGAWRRRLLSFCVTSENLRRALEKFQCPRVGMVAHGSLIVGKPDRYWESKKCFDVARKEVARMGLGFPSKPEFVAGTMFLVRSSLLRPVVSAMSPGLFEMNMDHATGTAAHSYERLFGYVVKAQGYEIADFSGVQCLYRTTEFVRIPLFRLMRWIKRFVLRVARSQVNGTTRIVI